MKLLLITYITLLNIQLADGADIENKPVENLTDISFLKQEQRKNLYHQLIKTIEEYDSEAIETRKNTKKVKWSQYKKHKRNSFVNAKSWKELRDSFNSFGNGFVNLHSSFKFNLMNEYPIIISEKINYSYPEVGFYLLKNNKQIQKVNGVDIDKIFDHYNEYDCNFNAISGCIATFTDDFNFGKVLIKNNPPKEIKTTNGEVHNISFKDFYGKRGESPTLKPDETWDFLVAGKNIEIYKKKKTILLRIMSFNYSGSSDIRCDSAVKDDSNICYDVRIVRKTLREQPDNIDNLIIDLQNNGGGNENTAFIAEFATKPFYDLQVQYRKTKILEENNFRKTLFWDSQKAENWYQNIIKNGSYSKTAYGSFLPKRADFCQASNTCELKEIQPNGYHHFKQLVLLTNQFCISSCDDMVWRLNEFAKVKIIGLPAAADITYGRISAVFYLDKSGILQRQLYAEKDEPEIDGMKIFSIKIPYTKGLDYKESKLIQGKSITPDLIVPVDNESLEPHNLQVLNHAYKYMHTNH